MKRKVIIILSIVLAGFILLKYFFKADIVPQQKNDNVAVEILPNQAGLPVKVEAKRQAIYKAALRRDYEKLAAEAAADLHYSFGGEYEGGFVGYLKLSAMDEGETAFDIIPTLLKLPYAEREGLYTWPSVFTIESFRWTEADVAMMKTFLTDKQIEGFREFGGYIYYRLGINSEGEWKFYLAGD